jgi:hypothetical protein
LRLYSEKVNPNGPDPVSKNDLQEMVEYIPLQLDKESPDFVQQLYELASPFNFKRSQLPLFLNNIYTNMSGDLKSTDPEGMDFEDS